MDIIETILYSKPSNTNNVKLIDADWRDDFGLVLILRKNQSSFIQIGDTQFSFKNLNISCNYPLIRWIDHNRFLIADVRTNCNSKNLYIFNTEGILLNSFHCGDAIEDIVPTNEGIWISYFDEGVFGNSISTEGLVLFSYDGTPIFKYHSDLVDCPFIVDCYAICRGKSSSIWIFPYSDFPLLCVNPSNKVIKSYEVPSILHGSSALCVRGKFAYFFNSYDSKGDLFCWEIGENHPQRISKISGYARGLNTRESNHFISIDENYVKAYRIINPTEYV